MPSLDIFFIDILLPTNTPKSTNKTPMKVVKSITSFKKIYPQMIANAGIKQATQDKKIGPAFEII